MVNEVALSVKRRKSEGVPGAESEVPFRQGRLSLVE